MSAIVEMIAIVAKNAIAMRRVMSVTVTKKARRVR
jgi:hypothetical protein